MAIGPAQPDSRPIPDPTVLTTEQLLREIEHTRNDAEARSSSLERLVDERFGGIQRQFDMVEATRVESSAKTEATRVETSAKSEVALAAALAAQKEAAQAATVTGEKATEKAQAATEKRIEQVQQTFAAFQEGILTSLGDLKDRVGRIESVKVGGQQVFAGLYLALGAAVGLIGLVAGIIIAVVR